MPLSDPGTSGNGPSTGNNNRKRNTLINNSSKSNPYGGGFGFPGIPPLDPYSTYNYASQLARLRSGYLQTLQGLKRTAKGAREEFRVNKADIAAAKLQGLGQATNTAIERGLLGSSIDVEGRVAVRGEAARALAEAKRLRDQTVRQAKLDRIWATTDFTTGAADLAAQQAMQQAQEAQQNFSDNLYDGPTTGKVDTSTFTKPLPNWYNPQLGSWNGTTLSVSALGSLQQVSKQVGVIISGGGYRSYETQAGLDTNNDGIKDGSNGVAVAPEGGSWHEVGLAVDVSSTLRSRADWPRIVRALRAAGWRDNVPGEPWHFAYRVGEAAGRGNPSI